MAVRAVQQRQWHWPRGGSGGVAVGGVGDVCSKTSKNNNDIET